MTIMEAEYLTDKEIHKDNFNLTQKTTECVLIPTEKKSKADNFDLSLYIFLFITYASH